MNTMTVEDLADLLCSGMSKAREVMKDPTFPPVYRINRRLLMDRSAVEEWIRQHEVDRDLIDDLEGEPEIDNPEDNMLLAALSADCGHERAADIDIDESQFEGAQTFGELRQRQAEARG